MTTTRRAHAMFIEYLLNESYQYLITARLQSDPVERFSKYRRMNGRRYLVNLREVRNSERIFQCRSLIKENINFWEEDLASENQECVTVTGDIFGTRTREIVENVLDKNSVEVITMHVARNFIKPSKCEVIRFYQRLRIMV